MKKIGSIIIMLALMLSLSSVAFAEPEDSSTEMGSEFTFTYTKADPSYTITIPSEVVLDPNGTEVSIEAKDVLNLDGKSIFVTIAGTNSYRDQFILESDTRPAYSMRYSITTANGEVLETIGIQNPHIGKQLASFDKDGIVSYLVTPIITQYTQYDVAYTGTITYGISVS